MKPHKTLLRSEPVQRLACWIMAQYIRLVRHTGRWSVEGDDTARRLWNEQRPFILCFWHGRLLMMPYVWRRDRVIHMLISAHRDGQLIAKTVAHFGIRWAAGSSTRGGSGALRAMLRAMKGGESVGITPDGPRGPRMRVGGGAVDVARMAGVPILPATFSCARGRVLGSWDRFLVAWPFTRGVFLWGEPIEIPRDADEAAVSAARERLEGELNRITALADARMGRAAVQPAPADRRGPAAESDGERAVG